MTALALPQKLSVTAANMSLCRRIGVKVDGRDMGTTVVAYSVNDGWVRTQSGETISGTVEPYWRAR